MDRAFPVSLDTVLTLARRPLSRAGSPVRTSSQMSRPWWIRGTRMPRRSSTVVTQALPQRRRPRLKLARRRGCRPEPSGDLADWQVRVVEGSPRALCASGVFGGPRAGRVGVPSTCSPATTTRLSGGPAGHFSAPAEIRKAVRHGPGGGSRIAAPRLEELRVRLGHGVACDFRVPGVGVDVAPEPRTHRPGRRPPRFHTYRVWRPRCPSTSKGRIPGER